MTTDNEMTLELMKKVVLINGGNEAITPQDDELSYAKGFLKGHASATKELEDGDGRCCDCVRKYEEELASLSKEREIVNRLRDVLKFQELTHEIITDGWGRDRHAEFCSVCEFNKALATYESASKQTEGNGQ